jgi:uncharacterized BrkB/YihY/UPF0761 family membrane protein
VAFVAVGFGSAVGNSVHSALLEDSWNLLRWPLAIVVMVAAMAILFQKCPRRHQPGWSWLAFGSSVSVLLWLLITLANLAVGLFGLQGAVAIGMARMH